MNTYLVAHYGKTVPTFSHAETLDEARSYALSLLNSRTCQVDDVVSIVNVANDAIICYGKRDELLLKLNVVNQPAAVATTAWSLSLKPVLNWLGMKLAGPSVG